MFDLIIKNGWVIDGSGALPFLADVAVLDDRVAAVGRLGRVESAPEIDATGPYVTPGFHDAHVPGGLIPPVAPPHLPAIKQGVTAYILRQDGSAFAPASPTTMDYMRRYTAGFNGNPDGLAYDWNTV